MADSLEVRAPHLWPELNPMARQRDVILTDGFDLVIGTFAKPCPGV